MNRTRRAVDEKKACSVGVKWATFCSERIPGHLMDTEGTGNTEWTNANKTRKKKKIKKREGSISKATLRKKRGGKTGKAMRDGRLGE